MTGWLARLFARPRPRLSEAAARDASPIAALHASAFRRGWSEEEVHALLLEDAVLAHRAMRGRKLAGFIMSRRAADEAEILSVAVGDRQRGSGLGRALLDLHLRRLAGRGVRTVFLEVDEANIPAIRLYRRAGFREVGRRPNYYAPTNGASAAALVLRRDLA
jgi:ribosomal-protein-alanine N-acetyltransferase